MTAAKTFSPKPRHIERRWYVVDADGAVLGRLASHVATILRGKHKPIFAPHADTGDHVIVVNAERVVVTGGKEEKKIYYRHSQYPGGLRETTYARMIATRPAVVVEKAIRGMLPKNRLGRQMAGKLSVYAGPEHPHQAQKPLALALGEVPAWEGLPAPAPAAPPAPKQEPPRRRRARPPGAERSAASRTRSGPTRGAPSRGSAASTRTARKAAEQAEPPSTGRRRRKKEKES